LTSTQIGDSSNFSLLVGDEYSRIPTNGMKGGGVGLSSVSSINDVELFVTRRTAKLIQIVQLPKYPPQSSMVDLVRLLLNKTCTSKNHLMDIVKAMVGIFHNRDIRLTTLDDANIFSSILSRILGYECHDFDSILDPDLALKLAFGLHHIHSQIDYLAASSPKARISERRVIIEKITGRHIPHAVSCVACTDLGAEVEFISTRWYSRCSNAHRQILCQTTFLPLLIGVECCWCNSVYNIDNSEKFISLCRFCRIGLTHKV